MGSSKGRGPGFSMEGRCNVSREPGVEPIMTEPQELTITAPDASPVDVSFEDFFLRQRGPMVRLATSLVDVRERAEEIVHDAFEKTLLAWDRLDQPGGYLRRCVVNGCHSELRRRRVVRRHADTPTGAGAVPADDMYLLDVLARLTPKRRIAVTLRFYADLTEADIAALLRLREGTVKSLISRGLADLRKVVEQ